MAYHKSFSKAFVLTIAVKVLGMLQHSNPLTELEVDIERLLFSLAVKMPNFWGQKKKTKRWSVLLPYDFCKNYNRHSSYHTTAVGECLVNIWFAEICQLTMCVFLEVNPCFQKAHVSCMDLQPAADPYNVVYVRIP